MELQKFARIGRSPIIKAIGLQKNHKEVYYTQKKVLDRYASGCFSCPNYKNIEYYDYMPRQIQENALKCCANCSHACYKTVTEEKYRYINETNMYGFAPRLKSIALKLLLIYHFKEPDENGLVRNLSPKQLADYLQCSVRSIRNANQKLQEYGYIYYSSSSENKRMFHIILPEYSTYALTADHGGRGYATLSREFLDELVEIQDINQLRIFMRAAVDADLQRDPDKKISVKTDYSSLRRFLPRYCKPGIIRKALSNISKLFDISYEEDLVYMQMHSEYHGRRTYEHSVQENSDMIRTYINSLDHAMEAVNQSILNETDPDPAQINFLKDQGIISKIKTQSHKKLYVKFNLTKKDYHDLGILAATYTYDALKNCIGYIYEHYRVKFSMQSMGALVRTLLQTEDFRQENMASAI